MVCKVYTDVGCIKCSPPHVRNETRLLYSLLSPFTSNLSIGRAHFQSKGRLVVFFIFIQFFKRSACKQTVENLIRRRVLWRLIWFCTVCRCPTKRALGVYGLAHEHDIYCQLVVRCNKCVIFHTQH